LPQTTATNVKLTNEMNTIKIDSISYTGSKIDSISCIWPRTSTATTMILGARQVCHAET